jgi:hypothetical protein
MLQDPAWMHGANRTIQNRTEMGTQSSREMTKDEMNVRGHVDVTGSTAVISRRGRGMRWRRRGLGLRDSRNEQWL